MVKQLDASRVACCMLRVAAVKCVCMLLLQVLSGHEGPVSSLCFSPIQSVLASVSWDKTVRLWDMKDSWQTREILHLSSDGKL